MMAVNSANIENSKDVNKAVVKLTMEMMEQFVEDHKYNLKGLDWKLKSKWFRWKECIDNPNPQVRVVYNAGKREWLDRWSAFLDRK